MGKVLWISEKRKRNYAAKDVITEFIRCPDCEWDDKPLGESPRTWGRLEVGITPIGLQVWCTRHDRNVIHVDYQHRDYPADDTYYGDFGGTLQRRKDGIVANREQGDN
jgi:hypothetical protein